MDYNYNRNSSNISNGFQINRFFWTHVVHTTIHIQNRVMLRNNTEKTVGRLVVVIDVNPSHGFWIVRLMKVFGHEGKCTCRYKTHGWIVYIIFFSMVCGTSRGSSWLRRNEFLKMQSELYM